MTDTSADSTGGCLCGAVRYAVRRGALRAVVACHCTQCRRITGHYLAATAARRRDFRLLEDSGLRWYDSSSEARRGFCGHCGSTLFWQPHGRDYISIAAGSLDDSSALTTACHIFVADKGRYYQIEPGVPQIQDGQFFVPLPDT
jgi:hypothetical protein